MKAAAKPALKVHELHDGERGILGAQERIVADVNRDGGGSGLAVGAARRN